jgi:type I restriction enzyme S subunit
LASGHSVANTEDLPDGFQMTELGPLPKEWRVVRLGEVLFEVDVRVKELAPDASHLPVLSLTKNDGLVLQTERFGKRIATDDVSDYKVVRRGQIVNNPYVIWEGAVHILSKYEAGLVSPVYPVWEVKTSVADGWFIDHLLRMPATITAYNRFAAGAVNRRRAIRKSDFLSIQIPLPPLPEQRAIAHVLRTVQRAKEATEGVIAALKELKKSLMQHLFTYGPVPVTERERVPLQETEIGPIPAHWRVVRLGEVFDILQGKSLSAKQNKGVRPRPFLRTSNVYWGYLDLSKLDVMDFTEEEEQKFALQHGDLLVCEGGDVGRTAMWEGQMHGVYYQNHLHRLRARDNNVNPAFVMYWLQTAFTLLNLYSGSSNKTTIPNLSRGRLAVFPIPLPPLDEQREIARMLQAVDAKIAAEERRRAALEEVFKTLLHALMSGRMRVPHIVGGERSCDSAPDADKLPKSED